LISKSILILFNIDFVSILNIVSNPNQKSIFAYFCKRAASAYLFQKGNRHELADRERDNKCIYTNVYICIIYKNMCIIYVYVYTRIHVLYMHLSKHIHIEKQRDYCYGVATISRLLQNIRLFCRISSLS